MKIESEQLIDTLVAEVIDGYLTKDISNMIEFMGPDRVGHLGCPLTFAVLSGMDFLGYLLKPKGGISDSTGNIGYYAINYFDNKIKDEETRKELGNFLAKEYRNCVNHHFIPKPGLFILKDDSNGYLIREQEGSCMLNVYLLGKLFLESLGKVKEDLLESMVRERAHDRFCSWREANKFSFSKELEPLFELEFPDYLPVSSKMAGFETYTRPLTSIVTLSGTGLPNRAE